MVTEWTEEWERERERDGDRMDRGVGEREKWFNGLSAETVISQRERERLREIIGF